jgi:hypothetical protein
MERYIARIGKILTTQKLPDRFIKTSIHYPNSPTEEEHGMLIFVVEILNPWFPAAEVGSAITKTMIDHYYGGAKHTDTLTRFEEALKHVNQKLAEIASGGVNSWVGNMNCTITALRNNSLYISHSGNSQTYLFRDKNLTEVTEDISSRDTSPISTFITITNGSLIKGDKLLIANHDILIPMPLQSLREIINYTDIIKATHQIGKVLKRKRVRDVNAALIEIISEKESPETESPEEDTVYLDQDPEGWWAGVLRSAKPRIASRLDRGGRSGMFLWEAILSRASDAVQTIGPKIRQLMVYIGTLVLRLWHQKIRGKTVRSDTRVSQSTRTKEPNYFLQKKQSVRRPGNLFINTILSATKGVFTNRKKFYIALTIALVLIFGISLSQTISRNSNAHDDQLIKDSLISAQDNLDTAKGLIAENQKAEARKLLLSTYDSLKQYTDLPSYRDQVNTFNATIRKYLDQVDIVTRIESDKSFDRLAKNIRSDEFTLLNSVIYFVDASNNLQAITDDTSDVGLVSDLPSGIGHVTELTGFNNSSILLYDDDRKIYQYNTSTKSFIRLDSSSGDWQESNDIQTFNSNIYLLGSTGQISRYTKVALGYGEPQNILSSDSIPTDKDALGFAVDGNIYTLFKDNKTNVRKFYAGNAIVEFELEYPPSGLPTNISSKSLIFTNSDINSIYVLETGLKDYDGKTIDRVIEFSKEGAYIKQYKFSHNLGTILDLSVDSKLRKLHLLFDNHILGSVGL